MGWFIWLVRLSAAAANANLFVDYLGEFWPGATAPVPRVALLALLLGGLAFANIRGVSSGARVSNLLITAKLVPIALLIVAGMLWTGTPVVQPAVMATAAGWMNAVLALLFAFGGFEA